MKKRCLTVVTLLALLLTACTPGAPPSDTAPTTSPTVATDPTVSTDPPETQPTKPPEPEVIQNTMSFTGDCTFGRNQKHTYANSFDQYYDKNGPDYFLEGVRSVFEQDDITIINLEGSLTTSTDIQDKKWNHKGDPEYVKIMTGSSVEIGTMGNNHRLDYGQSGCDETISVLEAAGIGYCYDDVYLIHEVKGVRWASCPSTSITMDLRWRRGWKRAMTTCVSRAAPLW